jgi:hypothetical protein
LSPKKKKVAKPHPLRTEHIFARAVEEFDGRRTIRLTDCGRIYDSGCSIPSISEMERLCLWMSKARAWRNSRRT